jgi:hypothetical protein
MALKRYALATMATVMLAGFSAWLLPFGWQQRHLYYKDYTFSAEQAQDLRHYPEAMLAFGQQAWFGLDAESAAHYYRAVVTRDAARMAAWLKLAQAEVAIGHMEKARAIVTFVEEQAGAVMFWQWPTALLAHDLGLEAIFRRCTNRLATRGWKLTDTFNLVDTHFAGDTPATLAALAPDAQPAYLEWLMRWGRLEDARCTWQTIAANGPPEPSILLKFVSFLISKKEVVEAANIYHAQGGAIGMTNGSFEQKISNKGFDWRWGRNPDGHWNLQQAFGQGHDRRTAVRLMFYGQDNLSFHHLYQIVPVTPGTPYQLRWRWRGKALTTDQGPFMEIYGYDCKGFHVPGTMLTGDHDWHEEMLAFTPPKNCQAVVIRLRRNKSKRFDSKIAGTLWVDDFRLVHAVNSASDTRTH